jgi:7-cyano-7-deazaguanine synthase
MCEGCGCMDKKREPVVVVLSGGQDSATCLALAHEQGYWPIHTISFDYGQRHKVELKCAEVLSDLIGAIHKVIPISSFEGVARSSLLNQTDDLSLPHQINQKLPASFVPGRNLIFLTLAAAYAYSNEIKEVWTGVCETDYSGYPDCRALTIKSLELSLNLGLDDYGIRIVTPLMYKTKAETVRMMSEMNKISWYAYTHTCYNGKQPPCGECPACKLRAKGFAEAGVEDPLL